MYTTEAVTFIGRILTVYGTVSEPGSWHWYKGCVCVSCWITCVDIRSCCYNQEAELCCYHRNLPHASLSSHNSYPMPPPLSCPYLFPYSGSLFSLSTVLSFRESCINGCRQWAALWDCSFVPSAQWLWGHFKMLQVSVVHSFLLLCGISW